MSDCFHCNLCDKSIKIKSKKKHLNSLNHKSLSMSIISKYSVINPDFLPIENIFKKYVLDYNKKFEFYLIICKWKFIFRILFIILNLLPVIVFITFTN